MSDETEDPRIQNIIEFFTMAAKETFEPTEALSLAHEELQEVVVAGILRTLKPLLAVADEGAHGEAAKGLMKKLHELTERRPELKKHFKEVGQQAFGRGVGHQTWDSSPVSVEQKALRQAQPGMTPLQQGVAAHPYLERYYSNPRPVSVWPPMFLWPDGDEIIGAEYEDA